MMSQRGIYFGFAGRGIEKVIVANAFLLREFDREKKQRRMNAFVGRFLEIVPAQETEHEPKLRKTKFGTVATRFTDDLVEHAGNVGCVFEPEILSQRHRRAVGD